MASKSNKVGSAAAQQPGGKPRSTRQGAGAGAAPAATPATPAAASAVGSAKGLLRAGLKALGDVRDDVALRRSRVFEALLGIDTPQAVIDKVGAEAREALGLHKFEAVFDQRVAHSLERLGVPSPEALTNLVRQLEAINQHLQRIEAPAPVKKKPRTPARKTAKP